MSHTVSSCSVVAPKDEQKWELLATQERLCLQEMRLCVQDQQGCKCEHQSHRRTQRVPLDRILYFIIIKMY